jgi:hypothetical protein
MISLTPADLEVIDADPVLVENYFPTSGRLPHRLSGLRYVHPPFDNVNVRLAFAKALDRESIVNNVIGPRFGIPAYSMLAPGFPPHHPRNCVKEYQDYDCEAAHNLLADAGYPGGEGFPAQTLQLRGKNDIEDRALRRCGRFDQRMSEHWHRSQQYGIQRVHGCLLARPTTLTFYGVDYGMDYLDPANLLGTLWKSDGRHSWRYAEFDEIATEANSLVGDPARREQLYRDAERILVDDVGAVFFFHRIQGNLFQPYLQGGFRELNAQGLPGWQWYNLWVWGTLYHRQYGPHSYVIHLKAVPNDSDGEYAFAVLPGKFLIVGEIMTGYIIRRLISLLFVLWAVVTIVFFLMDAVPGGPFTLGERGYSQEAMQNVLAKYGLDKPVGERYINYLNSILHFDFGSLICGCW